MLRLWLGGLMMASAAFAANGQGGVSFPVAGLTVATSEPAGGIVDEALRHFQARVTALGGPKLLRVDAEAKASGRVLRVGEVTPEMIRTELSGLKPFQKKECYVLGLDSAGHLYAGGLAPMGTVYAVSELELRLRVKDGKVYLDFPEWQPTHMPCQIFDKPAMEGRGEYLNIGYDLPQITPHEWSRARWHEYIDKLVLAKLNCLYFYVWNNTYTMYPGSELSKRRLNKRLHENLRDMIRYAHKRGLDVTYMCSPTLFPEDVWKAHPEMHADIVYVKEGFPVVCSRAPGAWDLMKKIARSEMEWFKGADAIQIWFYDPGGCWCTKYGCKQHQAEVLARQVKVFGDLFRQFNPKARIEYNLWPIWLWEAKLKIHYRKELDRRIRAEFAPEASKVTAVGTANTAVSMPLIEKAMGFRTGIFLFGTNPERSYVFTNPLLHWLKPTLETIEAHGFNDVFSHRLEAWTRYPQTFFQAQFMWNPEATPDAVVRKYADWQTADDAQGAKLAHALRLLDTFSEKGATTAVGARMVKLTQEVYDAVTPVCRAGDLEYLRPTMDALNVIAKSLSVPDTDTAALDAFAKRFQRAMDESNTFAAWKHNYRKTFETYRQWLKEGWDKAHF